MIEDSLYSYLTGQAAVTALVSNRIYQSRAPQNATAPYIVYHLVDDVGAGVMEGPAGLTTKRFQFVCLAATQRAAVIVADALRGVLNGFRGTMDTTAVGSVLLVTQLYVYDPTTELDGVSADYRIMYQL